MIKEELINHHYLYTKYSSLNPNDIIFGAIYKERLIGYVFTSLISSNDLLIIKDIQIKKEYRNRGIGSELISKLTVYARENKKRLSIKFFNLENDTQNKIFHFFRKNGWQSPVISRKNVIIDCKLASKYFFNTEFYDDFNILTEIGARVLNIAELRKNTKLKNQFKNKSQPFNGLYNYAINSIFDENKKLTLFFAINNELVGWIIAKYLNQNKTDIYVKSTYSEEKYRQWCLGIHIFNIGFKYLLQINSTIRTISFGVDLFRKNIQLLNFYKKIFQKSIINIVDVWVINNEAKVENTLQIL
ncbi:MAG: GNAT family N-acetyltransferase [Candidatus Symbiothrix sp.]|nr:GNAT family N-acetyltransferase [Candidatus Symbiothrix sp.]